MSAYHPKPWSQPDEAGASVMVHLLYVTLIVSGAVLLFAGLPWVLSHAPGAITGERAANTRVVYDNPTNQELLKRSNNTFYSKSNGEEGSLEYHYTARDSNGAVVEKTVPVIFYPSPTFISLNGEATNNIQVKVLNSADTAPYLSVEKCKLEPIDPDKPFVKVEPYKVTRYELGTGKRIDDTQLCEDKYVFWVPDGYVQP